MLFLRSLLFYIGMALMTIPFTLFALLLLPFPYPRRYSVMVGWGYFVLWWLKQTCHITYIVEGTENIPDKPSVILSKHQSAWETIALQSIFPIQVWVMKRELLLVPFFGWAIATLNPIILNRASIRQALRQLVEKGTQRLADGYWVVIFPEGTRVAPGQKKPYAAGGALLAARSHCLVVPVAHNAGKFWAPRSFIKYPGVIQVSIGAAIDPHGKTANEINAMAEAWIESKSQSLLS